ncbi:MAG: hypothetical protein LH479_02745 [Polaromonas sp.]|nr:hypothetical protein [Polaromonas sp.]
MRTCLRKFSDARHIVYEGSAAVAFHAGSNESLSMFSVHAIKAERWPVINLFVLAGLLVALCQLVALALEADGRKDDATVRDQRNRAHDAVMADCQDRMHLAGRPLRHGCIQYVQAALDALGNAEEAATMQPAAFSAGARSLDSLGSTLGRGQMRALPASLVVQGR